MKSLTLALLGMIATALPVTAFAGQSTKDQSVEVAMLVTKPSQTGLLALLSQDTTKKKQVKFDVNHSPVERQIIVFNEKVAPGTIIVDNSDRRLYHVIGDGLAVVYGVSVGRDGFRWTGSEKVTAKTEWPTWNPPEEMRIREAKKGHILPETMEGGLDNPLGARAMYLGSTEFRIHGTNQPQSIGKAMSSGCIRMANEDVEHLYASVKVGAQVIVRD